MRLKNTLNPNLVKIGLEGTGKEEIIRELLGLLKADGKLGDIEKAFADVMEREAKMSTGIQHGVAIPHAKTSEVKELVACIGIKKEGVDFASLDGKPSELFIMTLSPKDRIGPHVQFLAEISRIIKKEEARTQLLEATTVQEVLSVFGL
ncbi:MAG: PTS sugar transporter subunit IIA [Spirochaetia bacterium]|jgi:PTS system nitrogen regulatory IIA component|nr:PTS sugar transporter subunit IIA [Spirochaetia bacterium]